MKQDMTVPCGDGFINIRAGAIILRDGRFLMAGNPGNDYLYSVGGRVQFGETAEEAVIREVYEETGVHMEVDRLGFIEENYYIGDMNITKGKPIYEIDFYFYMKVPEIFEPVSNSVTSDQVKEYLEWVPIGSRRKMYPEFFTTELEHPMREVRHLVKDER